MDSDRAQPHSFSFHPAGVGEYVKGYGSCSCGWLTTLSDRDALVDDLTDLYREHLPPEPTTATCGVVVNGHECFYYAGHAGRHSGGATVWSTDDKVSE